MHYFSISLPPPTRFCSQSLAAKIRAILDSRAQYIYTKVLKNCRPAAHPKICLIAGNLGSKSNRETLTILLA